MLHRLVFVFLGVATLSCASAKPVLRTADALIEDACEVLAERMAERSHASSRRIIEVTCAVEGFTRAFRETLLSQQIEAARRAGVAVPQITSAVFEEEDREAAAE